MGLPGTIIFSALGYGFAYLLYCGSNESLRPETHSKLAKLKLIVAENSHVDTSKLEDPDFYLNATDRELFMIYERNSIKSDPQRLAQVVHEARQRIKESN